MTDRQRGWLLAGGGMLLVSTDSAFIRAADFDAWTISFVFGLASAIVLGTFFATTAEAPARQLRSIGLPVIALVALSAGTQLAFVGAVNNTAVSNVVVIVASTPLAAALLAWVMLRERASQRVIVAIVITMAGVTLVVGRSLGEPQLDGDLLALLAVALVALSLVIWRQHPDVSRPLTLALSSATMALIALPFADLSNAPARVFVAAGLMGVLFNPLGRLAYTSAPRYAPTAEVALFTPVETVAATLWAWWFFGEAPAVSTVAGGVIVIVGVLYGTVGAPSSRLSRAGRRSRGSRAATYASGADPASESTPTP